MAKATEKGTITQEDLERNFGSRPKSAARMDAQARTRGWWIAGGAAATAAIGGIVWWARRRPSADASEPGHGGGVGAPTPSWPPGQATPSTPSPASPSGGTGGPAPATPSTPPPAGWQNARPLPSAADVPGFDLDKNWGKTPSELRPLFALMEKVSGIDGSARIFATIAKRESGFSPAAHNDSAEERDGSRRGYANSKDRNPPLVYGPQAAEFGSGGLFGALGPYFLWTGVPEVGGKAPLLGSPPEIMFLPRVAAFGACVYLQRLLANYRIDDHPDIKVGWANPSLLKTGRGNATYQAVRTRFLSDAAELGVNLGDTTTIPPKLSAARWPGVLACFEQLVGALPTPVGG